MKLNLIEDALPTLKKLIDIAPENQEFMRLYSEAKKIYEYNLKKEKNIFKKMLFHEK